MVSDYVFDRVICVKDVIRSRKRKTSLRSIKTYTWSHPNNQQVVEEVVAWLKKQDEHKDNKWDLNVIKKRLESSLKTQSPMRGSWRRRSKEAF